MEAGMKRALLIALLAPLLGACAQSPVNDRLRAQWRKLTETRPAFESPADPVALSPSADSGVFSTDPDHDCSSCPPR
jgi:hypothetical protein